MWREFGEQSADIGCRSSGVQTAGQINRLAPVSAYLVELVLQGVPDGEQRGVEGLAADVARVHVERSQGVFLGLGALT
jgi:hypothetical protein